MKLNLDNKIILDIVSDRRSYERGYSLYVNESVQKLFVEEEGNLLNFHFVVTCNDKVCAVELQFKKNGEHIKNTCSCNANWMWRGSCEHVSAALFSLLGQSLEELRVSQEKSISQTLIMRFEEETLSQLDRVKQKKTMGNLSLIPQVKVTNNRFNISLYISEKRKYLIKNIYKFLRDVKKGNETVYGKNLTIKNEISSFDLKSQDLIELLMKNIEVYEMMKYNGNYYSRFHSDERFISMTPSMVNEFFEIFDGDMVDFVFNYDRDTFKLQILNENPEFGASVFYDGGYKFKLDSIPFFHIKDDVYSYFFFDTSVYKASSYFFDIISPFLESMVEIESDELSFTGAEAYHFEKIIMPLVREMNILKEENIVHSYNSDINKFYLEVDKTKIVCNAVVEKGGKEISILADSGRYSEFLVRMLAKMGFDVKREYFVISDDDEIYEFYTDGINMLRKYGEIYVSEQFNKLSYIPNSTDFNFDLRLTEDLLEVRFDSIEYSLDELLETLENATESMNYYRLKNGRFINLKNSDLLKTLDFLNDFNLSGKEIEGEKIKLPRYNALYLDSLIKNSRVNINIEDKFNDLINDIKNYNVFDVDTPEQFENILRDYQKNGFKWLATLNHYGFGGILADDMGLGKTVQVIALISDYIKRGGKLKQSLVVCPTSLVYNWQKEFEKFAPDIETALIIGTPSIRASLLKGDTANVLITTYDTLKRDIKSYQKRQFKFLIADEAQNIKNPQTQNSKAIKLVEGETRFALTGTPIENSLTELWSIFDFIMPGYLYSLTKFNKVFSKPILKENRDSDKLRNRIKPFVLRRAKKEVLTELPEKIESNIYAEMTEKQKKIYSAFLFEARGEFDSIKKSGEINKSKLKILALITRLRQICCDPSIIIEDYDGGSGKLEAVFEIIEQSIASGHRILLFSQFTKMLNIIKAHLDENGVEYFYLDGRASSKSRVDMCAEFNEGNRNIFLISLRAGGTGLNLTGADVVIHYDPWWNMAVMNQATDRAHRIGQEKVVQVVNVVSKDSIEEKILALQEKKRDLISDVLGEGENFVNKMSEQELENLFRE